MLHEILLALSGHPSPLFDEDRVQDFPHVSPAEIALLQSVGRLAHLHKALRTHVGLILKKHPSVICRAVASRVEAHHLSRFQAAILDTEKQILASDSSRVGAYNIVPLASVVGSFGEWRRRLEWYWELACFMIPAECSTDQAQLRDSYGHGPAVIDRLRKDCSAGYPDIEDVAVDLLKTAEVTWLRQLSSWLLKGTVTKSFDDDFFLQIDRGATVVKARLLPSFLNEETASSILYVSKTLNYIYEARNSLQLATSRLDDSPQTLPEVSLSARAQYVQDFARIKMPIAPSELARTVTRIRSLLSKQLTVGILPVDKLIGTLALLRDFHLMHKSDFAESLIIEANKHLRTRTAQIKDVTQRGSEALAGIVMKDSETSKVLQNTWAAMASKMSMDQTLDPQLEWARENVSLSLVDAASPSDSDELDAGIASSGHQIHVPKDWFASFLLSAPVRLSVAVNPPMDLFMGPRDVQAYGVISSYLIAIRRSHVHLSNLWRQSHLRKGASLSNSARSSYKYRIFTSKKLRERASARERALRPIWAIMGSAVFFLTELGEYLNSEVVTQSWKALFDWFQNKESRSRGVYLTLPLPSRPATAAERPHNVPLHVRNDSAQQQEDNVSLRPQDDPELLCEAHRQYLDMLLQTLLLTNDNYTRSLHAMLSRVEQLTGLVLRLQSVQNNLDLHDEGVDDGFSERYAAEEREVFSSILVAAQKVQTTMKAVTGQLRTIDTVPLSSSGMQHARARTGFDPWHVSSVDRLLLRLDLKLSAEQNPAG